MESKEQFEVVGEGLLVRAPAKINLSLLIAGKRADGYHEIETIMAKVNWYDEVLIEPGRKRGVEFICEGPEWAPEGEDNLVYRAAKMLLEKCARGADIKITLTKNVPAGTGLGSASSDAAAALMGLNRYLDICLPEAELGRLAAQLGSDVAFFLDGPLALCKGRGEKVTKLDENFDFLALLILPNISVSTERVYANYSHNQGLYNKLSKRINGYIPKNRFDLVVKLCANMLAASSFGLVKELAELKAKVESLGIRPACLSGSGSAMFSFIDNWDVEKAGAYRDILAEKVGCRSLIVSSNRW